MNNVYDDVSYAASKNLTLAYSTSFGWASRLFPRYMQREIFAVYGLVRVADEIVDTYAGADSLQLLNDLERETYAAMERGYSANVIVHAFQDVARRRNIDRSIIEPFFASMRMDAEAAIVEPDRIQYERYIYGSAEVVGLMCLRVFVAGDEAQYSQLQVGAKRLGAAYQKVNFLRDFASDTRELGRSYFPNVHARELSDETKQQIVTEIRQDFIDSLNYVWLLPASAQLAVLVSYEYYRELLGRLEHASAQQIATERIRVSNPKKLWVMVRTIVAFRLGIIRRWDNNN